MDHNVLADRLAATVIAMDYPRTESPEAWSPQTMGNDAQTGGATVQASYAIYCGFSCKRSSEVNEGGSDKSLTPGTWGAVIVAGTTVVHTASGVCDYNDADPTRSSPAAARLESVYRALLVFKEVRTAADSSIPARVTIYLPDRTVKDYWTQKKALTLDRDIAIARAIETEVAAALDLNATLGEFAAPSRSDPVHGKHLLDAQKQAVEATQALMDLAREQGDERLDVVGSDPAELSRPPYKVLIAEVAEEVVLATQRRSATHWVVFLRQCTPPRGLSVRPGGTLNRS